MIFFLFVSLLNKRRYLIDKNNECCGKSVELKSKIDQIEMEILKNMEMFFGRRIKDNTKSRYSTIKYRKVPLRTNDLMLTTVDYS